MLTVVIFGLSSALANGLYGHFYEPTVRDSQEKGERSLVPPILLYFLAGTAITFIGLIGSLFFTAWHIKPISGMQWLYFCVMVVGYATHIATEAKARHVLDMTVYNVFFQTQTIFLVLINVMIGKAVATAATWICVFIIVGAGITTVANQETWRRTNTYVLLAVISALARAIAFTIDGFLATEILNWWIYEGFTFLIPSLSVLLLGSIIASRQMNPIVYISACIQSFRCRKRGYALSAWWSGLEFLFGVASMNLAVNKALPSAIQGIVPVISLIIETVFHPHRIKLRIVAGALLATAALVTLASMT